MRITALLVFIALAAPYCSVEPKGTGDTAPPDDTGDTAPPEETDDTAPPKETGDTAPPDETGDTQPDNQPPLAVFTQPDDSDVVLSSGYVRVQLELSDDRDAPSELDLAWNAAAAEANAPSQAGDDGVVTFRIIAPIPGEWQLECTVTDLDGASTLASVAFRSLTDGDADGFVSITDGGDDCDDGEHSVNPSAEEICGDGMDNDCVDGDALCPDPLIVDGVTNLLSGERHFTAVSVINRGSIDVAPYNGSADTGWLHLIADSVTVESNSTIDGRWAGYRGGYRSRGEGPGGGPRDSTYTSGGGYGGRGDEGLSGCHSSSGLGGRPYGTAGGDDIQPGSGAGGSARFAGGNGGGSIRIDAAVLDIQGQLLVDGEHGTDGTGGGAGGGILLFADSGSVSGTMSAVGGHGSGGGGYAGGGGGGGGGRIKVFHGGVDLTGASVLVNGGDGDCNYHEPDPGTYHEEVVDTDRDGDGYRWVDGDCDDWDAAISPGQPEVVDGLDNDCDGDVDEHP